MLKYICTIQHSVLFFIYTTFLYGRKEDKIMKEFFDSELFKNIQRFFKDAAERIGNISEPGKPVIIKAFAALITLLTTLSLGMIVIDSLENKPQEQTTTIVEGDTTTTAPIETTTMPVQQLQTNILFCLDNENNNIHFLALANVDTSAQKVKLFFIEPTSVCQANETIGNMNYHLQTGGVTQLTNAVSVYTGTDVSKYLVGDEKAFINLVKYLGDLEINVENTISYNHGGLSYIIDKGVQTMTSDILLKYFLYLSSNTTENAEKIKELASLFAKTLFAFENSQQAQDNFGSVIGFFETNISAMDFSENKFAVINLSGDLMPSLEAYNSLAEFKGIVTEEKEQ